MDSLGKRVAYARDHSGLKPAGLARAIHTTPSHISEIERDIKKPSGALLVAVEYVTGVAAKWIETGEGEKFAKRTGQIKRASSPRDISDPSAQVARDIGMAWSILESDTSSAHSLQTNIHDFYKLVFGLPALAEQVGDEGLHESDLKALGRYKQQKIKAPKQSAS